MFLHPKPIIHKTGSHRMTHFVIQLLKCVTVNGINAFYKKALRKPGEEMGRNHVREHL